MNSRLLSPRLCCALSLLGIFLAYGEAGAQSSQVVPPRGLAPGSQYQLLFVTQGTRDALSANIADYNAFVTAEAVLSPALPSGVAWHAVGWTASVSAPVNAPSSGLPVYDTHGILLVPAGTGLYAGWMPLTQILDQFGEPSSSGYVWTGAYGPGYSNPSRFYLGDTDGVETGGSGGGGVPGYATSWLDLYAVPAPSDVVPTLRIERPNHRPVRPPTSQRGSSPHVHGPDLWGLSPVGGTTRAGNRRPNQACSLRSVPAALTPARSGTTARWPVGATTRTGQSTPPAGTFTQISAGLRHTCAIQSDGSLACWGGDTSGQSTPPAGSFVQVSAGDAYTCAIQSLGGGAPVCWGDNTYGQLGPWPGFESYPIFASDRSALEARPPAGFSPAASCSAGP